MLKTKFAKGYLVYVKEGSGETFAVPELNEIVAIEKHKVILKPWDEILTDVPKVLPIFVTNMDNLEVASRNKFDRWLDECVWGCNCFGSCDCNQWIGYWSESANPLKRMTCRPVHAIFRLLCWLLHDHSVDSM